jgi:RND superfamily putative drug exporter
VLFAGGTVVISLLGLCAIGLEYLYGTAAATVTGVLLVLVASMTLLPALLGFAGHRIDRFRIPFVRGDRGERGLWARWSRVVQRRPIVTGAASLAILLVLAAPFGDLRYGYPDSGTGPERLTSRRAYDLVAQGFGPGANGPLVLAVDAAGDGALVGEVAAAAAATPGVAAVLPPSQAEAGRVGAVLVIPSTGPQDPATEDLIHQLRDELPAVAEAGGGVVHVGGLTATQLDESAFVGGRLPWFIGAVIGLSFVLLLTVFRSVLVALKAAAMNLLAIGAAYGIMATALRGGWFGGLLGISEATPIPAWAPMMMFALLFGLSMDYEVFLLSRIREEYDRTGDNASAVALGMARTGRVITAAAAIMVTVFGAFLLGDQVLVKVIGLGMAAAVLLDATVVRMVLVPSTMELLGDRNWWLPRWLDRLLPRVDVEGRAHVVPAGEHELVGAGHDAR